MGYKIIEFWDLGHDWIIKQTGEGQYFRRAANSSDSWEPGLPAYAVETEIELLFLDAEEQA